VAPPAPQRRRCAATYQPAGTVAGLEGAARDGTGEGDTLEAASATAWAPVNAVLLLAGQVRACHAAAGGRGPVAMMAVSVTTGAYTRTQLQQYHPDHIIDSLEELMSIIDHA